MNARELRHERMKMKIVRSYFKSWIIWLLVFIMSISAAIVFKFTESNLFVQFPWVLKWAIVFCWGFVILTLLFLSLRINMKHLFLYLSTIFLVVGSLTNFEEPMMFLIVSAIGISTLLFCLDVLLGIKFDFTVKVRERPWCPNKESTKLSEEAN